MRPFLIAIISLGTAMFIHQEDTLRGIIIFGIGYLGLWLYERDMKNETESRNQVQVFKRRTRKDKKKV